MAYFSQIPKEVRWIIFNYVNDDLSGLSRSRRVCTDWKNTIDSFSEYWESQLIKFRLKLTDNLSARETAITYYQKSHIGALKFENHQIRFNMFRIELRLLSTRSSLCPSERLEFEVTITNESNSKLLLPKAFIDNASVFTNGRSISCIGPSGEICPSRSIGLPMKKSSNFSPIELDAFESKSFSLYVSYATEIRHFSFLEHENGPYLCFGTEYGVLIKQDGQYQIWIDYDCTSCTENYTQKLNQIVVWKGRVQSNIVFVDVASSTSKMDHTNVNSKNKCSIM